MKVEHKTNYLNPIMM